MELSDFGDWLEPMLRKKVVVFLLSVFFVGELVFFGLKAYRGNIVALQKLRSTQERQIDAREEVLFKRKWI